VFHRFLAEVEARRVEIIIWGRRARRAGLAEGRRTTRIRVTGSVDVGLLL